ncbi:MAG: heat-inducible transcriptional repressor HrcA [Candidatus Omnitrophica bacterium]|nr:heat-inducible transcriptional repressor HrcA [Candidatus Omnitrophota bacterium]
MNRSSKELRKIVVLDHIVREFIETAVPVSSRLVSERMGGSVSSATVRNIMSELEEEGYIEQPHTSAGRVPTPRGYRSFVDGIKGSIRMEQKEARRLAAEYDIRIRSINDIIHKTSYLISHELNGAGVVMWPTIEAEYLKHMQLVKVRAETVMAVLVTMSNDVKNYMIKLDRDIEKAELVKIAEYINNRYEAASMQSIYADLNRLIMAGPGPELLDHAKASLGVIDNIIEQNIQNEIYWEGLDHLVFGHGEEGINMVRRLLHAFSEKREITRLMMGELPYGGVRIYIGQETSCRDLEDCSFITAGYSLNGSTIGRIGVIGSTRMDYSRAISTVNFLAEQISSKIKELVTLERG